MLVVDEAAAIPLPIVSKLLGPYLVFMSSTVNGFVIIIIIIVVVFVVIVVGSIPCVYVEYC